MNIDCYEIVVPRSNGEAGFWPCGQKSAFGAQIKMLHRTGKNNCRQSGIMLDVHHESCIKVGIYNASVWYSTTLGVNVIRLENKHGRTVILIHGGTTVGNTDGCILVGSDINSTTGVLFGGVEARQEIIDYCQSSGWFPNTGASALVAWGEAYFAYCQDVLAWQRDERVIVEVTLSPALWATIGLSILSAF